MTQFDKEAHSFVIRLWRENRDRAEAAAEWRGWIEHVQSKQRHFFRDTADISGIVASYLHEGPVLDNVFEPVNLKSQSSQHHDSDDE